MSAVSIMAVAVVVTAWVARTMSPAADTPTVAVASLPEIGKPQVAQHRSMEVELANAANEQVRREEARARAEAKARAEAEAAARAEAERRAVIEEAARSVERAVEDPKSAARALMLDYEWNDDQFSCLDKLWTRESRWRRTAENPTSGAYGIPQSLPASKMARFGDDYLTNPITQIEWGLWYIDDRYGTPCAAWAHSEAVGWY